VLIRAYGENWDPDLVDWGRVGGERGSLQGEFGPLRNPVGCDVWDQVGIYVLLAEWKAVYVGKITAGNQLGSRLRLHRRGDLAGRWDRFSWYGIRRVNKTGKLAATPKHRKVGPAEIVNTLEALSIVVAEPARNRRFETIPNATLVRQAGAGAPKPLRAQIGALLAGITELQERVDRTDERLAQIEHELSRT
jgi:hypothetical protein